MIIQNRSADENARRSLSPRGWALWSVPAAARVYLLLAETIAAVLTGTLLVTHAVTHVDLIRFGIMAVLALGYAECAVRVERFKRYLGGGSKVFTDHLGVWTFAAVLTLPAGWAAAFVLLLYAQVLVQRHREQSGPVYRVVFTGAAAVLSLLAASGVLNTLGEGHVLRSAVRGPLAVVAALVVFTAVNLALMLCAMWLTARPPNLRAMLPGKDALGYELAALVLGVFTAEILLEAPALTPLTLVLIAYLHRSSLVNDLHRASRIDAKTGLLNNAAWTEHAEGALARSSRGGDPVTVLFCDLDRFKVINDAYGHLVGDRVLGAVGSCLRRELRGSDGLGRFGGEEFVIMLDGLDLADANRVAERLRAAVSDLRFDCGLRVTMSVGLAHHTAHDGPAALQRLLHRADAALRRAKASGRDRVEAA